MNLLRRIVSTVAWRLRCWWAAMHAVRDSEAALHAGPVRKVLVVCYGNIYRSPYAAALLRRLLAGIATVRSAGFHAVTGRPSPPKLIELAAQYELDLAPHRSTIVTAAELDHADIIVLMDRHNWHVARRLGGRGRRFVWLGAMDGGREIPDPYGRPESELRSIVDRLHRCTESLADEVVARHRSTPA